MLHKAEPDDQPQGQWSPSRESMASEQIEEDHHSTPYPFLVLSEVPTALKSGCALSDPQ
jgi:hypothetical protein